nr:uncharacterized protein CFP56_34811 [Quercus suber]
MLRRRQSHAHTDQKTQQTASAPAQVSMKTQAESTATTDRSYCEDSQKFAIYNWSDHSCVELDSPQRGHRSTMPPYRLALKRDTTVKACDKTKDRPAQSVIDRDHDVPYGSDSECRNASSSRVEQIKKVVGAQHDMMAKQCRDRITKQPQFDKQDHFTYPERSKNSMRQRKVLISDYDAVTRFFESRLKDMQQLATKKIAKAWIKGICPRKQALFPYQDSSRRRDSEEPNVPEWWPKPEFCSFREPDHIKKEGKSILAIRTRSALKNWHNGVSESTSTQASSLKEDWAPFLQSLAPASIFDDMPDIDGERLTVQRIPIDATEHYRYEEEEKRVKSSAKRSLTDSPDHTTYDNDAGAETKAWSPALRSSKRIKNSQQHSNSRTMERSLRMPVTSSVAQPVDRSGSAFDSFQPHMGLDDFNVFQQPTLDLSHAPSQNSPPVFTNDNFHDATTDHVWLPTTSGTWPSQQQSIPSSPVWARVTLSCSTSTVPSFDTSNSDQTLDYDPCLTDFEYSNVSSQRDYNHNYNSSFHQQNQAQHLQVNTAHVPVPQFEPILSPMGTSSLPFDFPITPAIQDMFNYTSSNTAPMCPTSALRAYDPSAALADGHQWHSHGHEKLQHRHSIACMVGASGDPPSSSSDHYQSPWTTGTHMEPPGGNYTYGSIGHAGRRLWYFSRMTFNEDYSELDTALFSHERDNSLSLWCPAIWL